MATRRHATTDEQWARVEGVFPANGKRGGQWKDHRLMLDAMLWVLKTGAPWRDLPERPGPWKTASERFPPVDEGGALGQGAGAAPARRARARPDPGLHRRQLGPGAPPRGGRPEKGGRGDESEDHALGGSRGGWGTKVHLVCDRKGRPAAANLSAGQAHETRLFEPTMALAATEGKPEAVAGDKGYSSGKVRAWIAAVGALDVVPTRSNEARNEGLDKDLRRGGNVVERCFGWLKECRRVATRYEKLVANYLGMVKLAMIRRLL